MATLTATITSKGQITIPKSVRDALGLAEGQQVIFMLEDGRAYLHPVARKSLLELRGVAAGLRPFPGREAEREAAEAAAVAEVMGSAADPVL